MYKERRLAHRNSDLYVEASWWFINRCKTPAELREADPKAFAGMTNTGIASHVIRDYMTRNAKRPA